MGNIWNLGNNSYEGTQIKLNKIFNQIAIGTGVGLRIDVDFFVFRLDAGFKFKDPQFEGKDQYVYKLWFNKEDRKAFQSSYRITNKPDEYSLMQIQFGIGLPF